MPDPTPNLGLERPDFNVATWHDQVNGNFTILDAAVAGLVNITGVWENDVAYVIGDFVVDSTDATIWECLVNHTSSASGPMSVDRLANPTYWQQVADIATLAAQAQASADSALASAAAAAASAAAAATAVSTSVINVINVKNAPYNAVGDGVADDTVALQAAINAAFVINLSTADSTDPAIGGQSILYIPAGVYKVTSSLNLLGTYGAVMMGAGRLSSRIKGVGCNPIVTNGCAYTRFADFSIEADGGICFDLDWDGTTYISLQSNTFENMLFQNVEVGFTSIGVRIGQTSMGSENTFLNCYWSDCDFGLITKNFNALQNQVIGGNFQGGDYAIYIDSGSVPVISNVGFQNTSTFDIRFENSANDVATVTGCRTESQHFIHTDTQPVVINGCNQGNVTSGTFLESNSNAITPYCTLSSCISIAGKLRGVFGSVDNCQFGRNDWADGNCTFWARNLTSGLTILGQGTGTPSYDAEGYYTLGVWKIYRATDFMAWDDFTTTLTAIGGTSLTLAGADFIVPDDPYDATNWNANLEVPTKNAVRDKIETLSAGAAAQVREVTAAGAITANATTDDVIIVNKTVGAATTVNLPAVASRSTSKPYYIVDGKLDAGTNNITIDPNGAETVLGLSTWLINTNGGAVTIWPMPSGGKWYIT